ncbi:MAG: hypothetical protein AAB486_01765 [Patescibacteria group bacterium]
MKKIIFLTTTLILLPLLQISVFGNLTFSGQTIVNALFILSLALFFQGFPAEAYLAAIVGGLLLDLFGLSGAIGLWGLLLSLALFILSALKGLTHYPLPVKIVSVLAVSFIIRVCLSLPGFSVLGLSNLFLPTLLETLIFFLVYPFCAFVIRRVFSEGFLQLDFRDRI